MGLTMGKIILGKITVETPKHEVLQTGHGYEIRKYPPCVSAEVTYDAKDMKRGRDGGLEILADYIGAFGKPKNTKKIAMKAPVITSSGSGGVLAEAIAMTAPVIASDGGKAEAVAMTEPVSSDGGKAEVIAMTEPVSSDGGKAEAVSMAEPVSPDGGKAETIAMTAPVITSSESEPVAMTAPVTTAEGREDQARKVTMQFLLPSKYTKVEETPWPTDERVVLRELGERKYGVVRFAGLTPDKVVEEKATRLKAALEKDGHVVKGPYMFSRYNPTRTLPPLRTNEVMFPVE
ncbi:unnamed protein product [Alopecurus aequalis]